MVEKDSFFTCASGGLGYGLPAAVGVAIARPDVRVIALLGDGSSMYSIQGLWSAAQLGVRVTFIIINNGAYRALDDIARLLGLERVLGTKLEGIDFSVLARAQGVEAERVASSAALDSALERSFIATGPALLEVITS